MALRHFIAAGLLGIAALAHPAATPAFAQSAAGQVTDAQLQRIRHILVIYAENRSFDHLYGNFPGANGLANATPEQTIQRDHDGTPLPFLTVWVAGKPDPRFPQLPNGPFRIDAPPISRQLSEVLPSPIHAYFHNIEQINGGRNDHFVAMSTVGAWAMGHFDSSGLRLWQYAKEFTLADNFFMGAFGGSFLNHQYLICACAPRFADAPADIRVELGPDGKLRPRPGSPSAKDGPVQVFVDGRGGQVTADGYAVNTTQPPFQPSGVPPAPGGDPGLADPAGDPGSGPPLPVQTARTIGDTLSAAGIGWAWYAGAWRAAEAEGHLPVKDRKLIYKRAEGSPNFQPHHQPFNYYARFRPGAPDRAEHLRDGDDLLADIDRGTLPAVAFYKPAGIYTQHPSYTDLVAGDTHIAGILDRVRANPALWADTVIIVTYDENGGFWDHVAPPSGPGWGDRWGPATRIPTLVVSPFARQGAVDHTAYDTGSIAKLITRRFGLEPLAGVRPNAGDMTGALQFP